MDAFRREGTGGWRRLPKRLGAVSVSYKCHGHGLGALEEGGGGGVGTRPWWLALVACGGAY